MNSHLPPSDPAAIVFISFSPGWLPPVSETPARIGRGRSRFDPVSPTDTQEIRTKLVTLGPRILRSSR